MSKTNQQKKVKRIIKVGAYLRLTAVMCIKIPPVEKLTVGSLCFFQWNVMFTFRIDTPNVLWDAIFICIAEMDLVFSDIFVKIPKVIQSL